MTKDFSCVRETYETQETNSSLGINGKIFAKAKFVVFSSSLDISLYIDNIIFVSLVRIHDSGFDVSLRVLLREILY